MKLGFGKLKVNAGIRSARNLPMWHDNQSDQPTQSGFFPTSAMRLAHQREVQYHVTILHGYLYDLSSGVQFLLCR
jgi:hypothetical protein